MKRLRALCYLIALLLLIFLYYGIADMLFPTGSEDEKHSMIYIGVLIAPVTLLSAIIRIFLVRRVNSRHYVFDFAYCVVSLLIIVLSLATQGWIVFGLSIFGLITGVIELIFMFVKREHRSQ